MGGHVIVGGVSITPLPRTRQSLSQTQRVFGAQKGVRGVKGGGSKKGQEPVCAGKGVKKERRRSKEGTELVPLPLRRKKKPEILPKIKYLKIGEWLRPNSR